MRAAPKLMPHIYIKFRRVEYNLVGRYIAIFSCTTTAWSWSEEAIEDISGTENYPLVWVLLSGLVGWVDHSINPGTSGACQCTLCSLLHWSLRKTKNMAMHADWGMKCWRAALHPGRPNVPWAASSAALLDSQGKFTIVQHSQHQ